MQVHLWIQSSQPEEHSFRSGQCKQSLLQHVLPAQLQAQRFLRCMGSPQYRLQLPQDLHRLSV